MLTSVLLKKIQDAMEKYGDMPVAHWTGASPQTSDCMIAVHEKRGPFFFVGQKGMLPIDSGEGNAL